MSSGETDAEAGAAPGDARSGLKTPRRVLVTGASGFVGCSVIGEFEQAGHDVTGTSTSGGAGLSALDLDRPDQIAEVVEQVRPEVIVHLAGLQSMRRSWQDPDSTFRINTGGTATLLREVDRRFPEAHFLLASTAAVYGDPPAGSAPPEHGPAPFRESDPMAPRSPYGASKAAAEVLALETAERTGMPVTIARLFNQTGAGQPAGQVPAGFAAEIAHAEAQGEGRVTLEVGDPAKARDFTDTRDTARALRLLVERGVTGRVNVCTGESRSLARVIEGLARASRIEIETRRSPGHSNPNDVPVIAGSPDRLKRETGWEPSIALDTSLAELLESQRAA